MGCQLSPNRHLTAAPCLPLPCSALPQKNSAYLQEQLERQRAFHASNLESYRAAREAYLKKAR